MNRARGRVAIGAFLLCLLCLALSAQQGPVAKRFELIYANDYFLATDYYFTQGIAISYTYGPHRYRIVQEGYTPTSISADRILVGDRPYAGALYLSYQREVPAARGCSEGSKCIDWSWGLDVGVIGPASLAAAEQKWIHRQTGNIEPRGWDFQVKNDLLLNGTLEIRRSLMVAKYFLAIASAHVSAGSYRSRVEVALPVIFGVLPNGKGNREANLYFKPSLRVVGHDATLQGGLFSGADSPYTISSGDIDRLVGILNYGVKLSWSGVGVDFSYSRLGQEFRGGRSHGWGTAKLSYSW